MISLQAITLKVPDHIYERSQQVAETTDQPMEAVFLHELETAFLPQLPPDEEADLTSLKNLSDDALWTITPEQMTAPLQAQMQKLMNKNSCGTITPDEYKELED